MTYRKRYAYRQPFGAAQKKKHQQGGFLLVTFLQSGLCIFMVTAAFFLSGILGMTEIKTAYSKLATDETDAIAVFSAAQKAVQSEEAFKFKKVIEIILRQIIPNVYNAEQSKTTNEGVKPHLGIEFDKPSEVSAMHIPVNGRITSHFGERENPVTGKEDWHTGIDIAVPEATPIAAAWAGKVTSIGNDKIYGNFVAVDHGEFETRYCHCSSIKVKEGELLKQGDVVALSGSTGMVTGPHLHFELITSCGYIDPISVWNGCVDFENI